MKKLSRIFYIITAILLLMIPAWMLIAVPQLESYVPQFTQAYTLLGQTTLIDENLDLSKMTPNIISETITVDDENVGTDKIKITELVTDKYLINNEIFWQNSEQYLIDVLSYKIIGNLTEEKLKPPVKPKDYRNIILLDFYKPIDLKYAGEETINDLDTYKFTWAKLDIDTSGSYHKKYLPKSYQNSNGIVWIEPTSGYIIKFQYDWDVYTEPNKKGINIEKGYVKSTEDSIINRVNLANSNQGDIIMHHIIIPIFFAIVALALLLSTFIANRKN